MLPLFPLGVFVYFHLQLGVTSLTEALSGHPVTDAHHQGFGNEGGETTEIKLSGLRKPELTIAMATALLRFRLCLPYHPLQLDAQQLSWAEQAQLLFSSPSCSFFPRSDSGVDAECTVEAPGGRDECRISRQDEKSLCFFCLTHWESRPSSSPRQTKPSPRRVVWFSKIKTIKKKFLKLDSPS